VVPTSRRAVVGLRAVIIVPCRIASTCLAVEPLPTKVVVERKCGSLRRTIIADWAFEGVLGAGAGTADAAIRTLRRLGDVVEAT